MKLQYFILAILCPFLSMCQSFTIRGKIINENSEPVPAATITLQRTGQTTTADKNGNFTIHHSLLTDTLIVSAIGYQTVAEPNNERGLITITLRKKITQLQDVQISTGYQQLPKERATGSFVTIDNKSLSRSVSSGIISRLQDMAPGLVFDKNAGNSLGITIRGLSSMFISSQPLIVVDNFPYYAGIQNINPADIASVTILKDAAAASIWGAAAGNGVIIITTKKGSFSKPVQVALSSNLTITAAPDFFYYPAMSSSDFINVEKLLFAQGYYNAAINNTTTRPVLSPAVEILLQQRNGLLAPALAAARLDSLRTFDVRYDIQDNFYRTALDNRQALSLSGGSPVTSYYLGLGYDDNLATSVGNRYTRYSLTTKNSFRPFNNVLLQAALLFTQSHKQINNLDGAGISTAGGKAAIYPYARLVNNDGTPAVIPRDYRLAYIDTAGRSLLQDWKYRPLDELRLADNKSSLQDINLSLGITYSFLPWLAAEMRLQYGRQSSKGTNYYSPETYFTRNLINRFSQLSGNTVKYIVPPGGIIDIADALLTTKAARAQLNINRRWAVSHRLDAIIGAESRQLQSSFYGSRQYGFSKDFLTYYNMDYLSTYPIYGGLSSAQRIVSGVSFADITNRFVSLYANAAYTLLGKYTFSASARKDASNLFGVRTNQKAVPLWSSGLAWDITKEDFYSLHWLPQLRLRTTFGFNGNADNSRSAWATIEYSSAPDVYTNLPYATIANPPNPGLRWEKTGILNLGLDFAARNNRISGTVEYYRKRSIDLLASAPADPTTGFTSLVLNSAVINGRGWDCQFNTINTTGQRQWSSTFIFAYTRNILTRYLRDIGTARSYVGAGNTFNPFVGKDAYALFSYRWAGLDPLTGDPQGYLSGQPSKNYTAIRNDSVTSLVYHGAAAPLYTVVFRNTIAWKNFSLSFTINGKLAYWFRRSSINYSSLAASWTSHSDYALRWQQPGDEQFTQVPSFVYPLNSLRDEFYTYSEVLAERADHIRFKDIRLEYDWNNTKAKKTGIKNCTLYLFADNIGILWRANKYKLDPDFFRSDLPVPRSITLGAKLEL